MPLVASSNPTLRSDAFACWWCPCGVTWDAVPEEKPLFKTVIILLVIRVKIPEKKHFNFKNIISEKNVRFRNVLA